jgi:hypothetical protein
MNFRSIDNHLLTVLVVAMVALLGAAVLEASALDVQVADAATSLARSVTADPVVASAPQQATISAR